MIIIIETIIEFGNFLWVDSSVRFSTLNQTIFDQVLANSAYRHTSDETELNFCWQFYVGFGSKHIARGIQKDMYSYLPANMTIHHNRYTVENFWKNLH